MANQIPLADLDYYYQQALRKRDRTPVAVSATPSTRDIDMAHIMAATKKEEDARQFTTDMALKEKWLSEISRRHGEEMAFKNEQLTDAEKANRLANIISVGNIGVTGLAGLSNLKEAEKQRLQDEQTIASMNGIVEYNQRLSTRLEDLIQKQISVYKKT